LKGQPESGFVSLFDGRSLDGWSIREGPESAFYVSGGEIVVHEGSGFPTWLRSAKQYENFDFRCEFFIKGWIDAGIFLHAPEHGRNTETGAFASRSSTSRTKRAAGVDWRRVSLDPPLK
jgi:hypothetical protein